MTETLTARYSKTARQRGNPPLAGEIVTLVNSKHPTLDWEFWDQAGRDSVIGSGSTTLTYDHLGKRWQTIDVPDGAYLAGVSAGWVGSLDDREGRLSMVASTPFSPPDITTFGVNGDEAFLIFPTGEKIGVDGEGGLLWARGVTIDHQQQKIVWNIDQEEPRGDHPMQVTQELEVVANSHVKAHHSVEFFHPVHSKETFTAEVRPNQVVFGEVVEEGSVDDAGNRSITQREEVGMAANQTRGTSMITAQDNIGGTSARLSWVQGLPGGRLDLSGPVGQKLEMASGESTLEFEFESNSHPHRLAGQVTGDEAKFMIEVALPPDLSQSSWSDIVTQLRDQGLSELVARDLALRLKSGQHRQAAALTKLSLEESISRHTGADGLTQQVSLGIQRENRPARTLSAPGHEVSGSAVMQLDAQFQASREGKNGLRVDIAGPLGKQESINLFFASPVHSYPAIVRLLTTTPYSPDGLADDKMKVIEVNSLTPNQVKHMKIQPADPTGEGVIVTKYTISRES